MAGHVTLSEVKSGLVDLVDLLKLNALMDAQDAAHKAATEKANK